MMTPAMFRAVFTATIDYVVERLNKNPLLQTVANYLLANRTTSSIFATILVEYLLERMDEMGCEFFITSFNVISTYLNRKVYE